MPRPYIPASLRLQVFRSIHDLSHPGTKTTAKLIAQRFVWPDIQRDCRTWARTCQACQKSNFLHVGRRRTPQRHPASRRGHQLCGDVSSISIFKQITTL
jgi:hypothetical protein